MKLGMQGKRRLIRLGLCLVGFCVLLLLLWAGCGYPSLSARGACRRGLESAGLPAGEMELLLHRGGVDREDESRDMAEERDVALVSTEQGACVLRLTKDEWLEKLPLLRAWHWGESDPDSGLQTGSAEYYPCIEGLRILPLGALFDPHVDSMKLAGECRNRPALAVKADAARVEVTLITKSAYVKDAIGEEMYVFGGSFPMRTEEENGWTLCSFDCESISGWSWEYGTGVSVESYYMGEVKRQDADYVRWMRGFLFRGIDQNPGCFEIRLYDEAERCFQTLRWVPFRDSASTEDWD